MSTNSAQGKSGLKSLKTGEILFNEGDNADSLYIIQKGQIRLFKPKGKGFVELAVLRSGEVIGEMAYFDEDGPNKKRSCSASAITGVEVIEISFPAFGKTMQSLNPWFKTIITTLVARLRKTNIRIRELEDNQATVTYGKHSTYEFVKPSEVTRILGTLFLVFKAHGEIKGQDIVLSRKILSLYTQDMYQINEAKLESIIDLLVQLNLMEVKEDEEKLPNILILKNLDIIRQIFIFYSSEKSLPEEKKLKIGEKCEMLIGKMLENQTDNSLTDIPNVKIVDGVGPRFTKYFDITSILEHFKNEQIAIHADHVDDARAAGLFGEVMNQDGATLVETDMAKVQKLYPIIRFINAVKRLNAEKAPAGAY